MALPALELDLEVFHGPFDLLLALVLREEIDLLELDLAEVVLAYLDHLERTGELDLEATTEFLVLIAALLELKSRLMLPREEDEPLELAARRRRGAARPHARVRPLPRRGRPICASGSTRRARLPLLRRRSRPSCAARLEGGGAVYEPEALARALGDLLRSPPSLDVRHMARPAVSLDRRLAHLRALLAARARVTFDECVEGVDRTTEAVTLFALLELYKSGEAAWEQAEPLGPIEIRRAGAEPGREAIQP